MGLDKATAAKLKRFAQVFQEAQAREANESDTVMYLIKFFEDVLGYDSLANEITKEVAIKDRYCDFAVKLDGGVPLLVEAKAAGNKTLREKDIEQAENYASRSGIKWVLLTNGVEWKLYHLSFNEGEGIAHDLAFDVNLVVQIDTEPDRVWDSLSLLTKESIQKGALEVYWSQRKTLQPASLVRVLFDESVLQVIRRELNRNADARLDLEDVFQAVKEVISKDALMAVGDITFGKKRKRRRKRKVKQVDAATGQTTEVEIEEDHDDDEPAAEAAEGATTSATPSAPRA